MIYGGRRELLKEFNTTAVCTPERDYMVDLSERVREIKKLVDEKKYFPPVRFKEPSRCCVICSP